MSYDMTYCANAACPLAPVCQRAHPPNKDKLDWHSEMQGRMLSWAKFEPRINQPALVLCDDYVKRVSQ
jgi:hypothetical protein